MLIMQEAAKIFRALADPTRREILRILKPGALAAGEIAAQFEMSAPSISRHLAILSGAGLVAAERDGNRLLYSLESQPLAETLGDFLSAVCPTQRRRRRSSTKKGKSR
ncbi:MAG: transcriptional regulator [Planctomycetota bacterium]|nr:MAG: transcriptional regulator [Planctomycetota bacterium]